MDMSTPSSFSVGQPRMTPNRPNRMNFGRTILLSFSFTIVLLVWSYFNFKVPRLLYSFLPGQDALVGLIMALDNIIAVIVQPFFGDLSDRTKSRFGRRMPFILFGTLTSAVLFVFFPHMGAIWGLVGIIFAFDLAMSLYRTASIAIVPDYTSEKFRAQASGVQQLIANLGGAVGFAIPMIVGILPPSWQDVMGFYIVAALMVVFIVVQVLVIKETPTGNGVFGVSKQDVIIDSTSFEITETPKKENEVATSGIKKIGAVFTQRDKSMLFTLIFVFFTFLAFAGVEAFFSSFAIDFLGKTEGQASTLFLAYPIPMIVTAYFHGWLGQKIGRKNCLKIGMGALGFFLLAMILFSVPKARDGNSIFLFINLILVGTFWMMVIVNTFPVVWSLAPKGQVGSYTGIYYTFNQLAYTLSPIIMGGILQVFGTYVWPSQPELRFITLFPYVFLCLMIAFVFLFFIKGGEANISKEKVEEYTGKYVKND